MFLTLIYSNRIVLQFFCYLDKNNKNKIALE